MVRGTILQYRSDDQYPTAMVTVVPLAIFRCTCSVLSSGYYSGRAGFCPLAVEEVSFIGSSGVVPLPAKGTYSFWTDAVEKLPDFAVEEVVQIH
jgi:hypothetical protein